MLTRCPECGTTFRVTPEQLKMRSGRVRCGACRRVFDALETLADEAQSLPVPTAASAVEHASAGHETAPDISLPTAEAPSEAFDEGAGPDLAEEAVDHLHTEELTVDIEAAGADWSPAFDAGVAAEEVATGEVEMAVAEAGIAETAAAEAAFAEATAATGAATAAAAASAEKERQPRTWPWLLGVCVASLVLAVQALLLFRTEIAVLYPDARPLLASTCDLLGCKLWLPRKPDLVGIEASDLSVGANGRLTLTATLRNRAPFAQEYPHLELTLTDAGDRALVRRVLAPTEYLPPQTPFAAGFGSRAEAAVNLAIATPDVPAAGYRLYLFYP